jgi:hypothetical protein
MNNTDLYNSAIKLLDDNHLKYEVSSFASGAFMIDFSIKEKVYCIQIYNGLIGISDITMPDFSTVPDISFDNVEQFERELKSFISPIKADELYMVRAYKYIRQILNDLIR